MIYMSVLKYRTGRILEIVRPYSLQFMHETNSSGESYAPACLLFLPKVIFQVPSPPAPRMQVTKGIFQTRPNCVGKECCSLATLKYVKKSNDPINASRIILQGAVSLCSALSIMGVAAGVALGVLLMISIEGRLLSTRKLGNLGITSPLVVTGLV